VTGHTEPFIADTDPRPFWPKGLRRDLRPLPQTMCEALRHSAARVPDRTAIVFYGAEISYRELLSRVETLAAWLQHEAGLAFGDRVLLDMQNSPHFIIAYQAILRAGGVVVPVNPMNLADELAYLASDSGAKIALIGAELIARFKTLSAAGLRIVVAAYGEDIPVPAPFTLPAVIAECVLPAELPPGFVSWAAAMGETRPPRPDTAGWNDLCVMPYTSGTTGKPKACMHPHSSAVFTAVAQAEWYGFGEDSVLTAFMPMFHVAGMQFSMNGGLSAGATLIVMCRWDRDLIGPLFRRYHVTAWSAAPTMVVDVLAASSFEPSDFKHLRTLTGGGATMPAAVVEELQQRYGLTFVEGYGLSESLSATHINPPDRAKPQCLGIPIHETVSKVIDPETLEDVPDGTVGEIIIAGPQIMRGYWNRPDADAGVFLEQDGHLFLRTGDLGYRDDDGYYFLVDRLKRMISVSGYKVWPAECEAMLYRHPAIQECCVIAAPDSHSGELVKAFVVLKAGQALTAAELIQWARGIMAAYKAPRQVEFVTALPRSGSNKIDWRKLQDQERATVAGGTA
jgi:fatty-acyl-CoA synthase